MTSKLGTEGDLLNLIKDIKRPTTLSGWSPVTTTLLPKFEHEQ